MLVEKMCVSDSVFAWMYWDCLAFSGLSMFPREYWFEVFLKYSKWASLDNVRNISAILRACGRRWRWSVLPSLCGVWSVECGVPNICLLATWPPTGGASVQGSDLPQRFRHLVDSLSVLQKMYCGTRSSSAMKATTATVHFFKNGDVRKWGQRVTLENSF